jgi:integrase
MVNDLPAGFRFHDLRHYYASILVAAGLDVKVVQARLRHARATTTQKVYGTCGRTAMSPHGLPLPWRWQPVRTNRGTREVVG